MASILTPSVTQAAVDIADTVARERAKQLFTLDHRQQPICVKDHSIPQVVPRLTLEFSRPPTGA